MKKKFITTAFIVMSLYGNTYAQSWKQLADSASSFYSQNKLGKAIDLFKQVTEILKKDSANSRTYASNLDSLGLLLYATKQYTSAEKCILEAKDIQEKLLGKENLDYAYSCSVLGMNYRDQGQNPKAVPYLRETKEIREKILGKDHNSYANACNNLAVCYNRMGQVMFAIPLWLETKRVREKVFGKHADYAGSCVNLAIGYNLLGQADLAESLFLEAKEIQEKEIGTDHIDYAATCLGLGGVYIQKAQFLKALPYYENAKRIREKLYGKNHPDYANSCFSLGLVYWNLGRFNEAVPFISEAREIQKKSVGTENFNYAYYSNALANVYKGMGQIEQTEALYLESKQIIDRLVALGNPLYAATIRNDLADFYRTIGRYEEAEQLLLEAKPIFEKVAGKKSADYATVCDNLANLYISIGQYEKSEQLFIESMEIRKKSVKLQPQGYIVSCNNLSGLYMSMGYNKKALDLLLEAKGLVKDTIVSSFVFASLGNVYESMKQSDSAAQYFQESLQILEKAYGKEHRDYLASSIGLAAVYMDRKHYQKAEAILISIKGLQEKLLGKQHPDFAVTCNNLGEIYWVTRKPVDAEKNFTASFNASIDNLENVFRFTNEKEKTAFIKNRTGEDDKAYSFYISEKLKSGLPYSMSLFHRNLILSSSTALKNEILASNDTGLINKYNHWVGLKKYLSILYSQPVNDRKENAAEMEENTGKLEKELAQLSPGFQKQQQHIDWKEIKAQLKQGEAALEFTTFRFYKNGRFTDSVMYAAFIIRKERNLPAVVYLFNEKQLMDQLSPSRIKSGKAVTELYAARGIIKRENVAMTKSLYDLIWKPLEKELTGIKTVYFAPSGLLHRISFAALPVDKSQVLSDHYQLVQLNSTAAITEAVPGKINPSDKITLYGGIDYDADSASLKQVTVNYQKPTNGNTRSLPADINKGSLWNKLEGTQMEIDGINKNGAANYAIMALSGIDANEESVKALDAKSSPAVLHIASHGFFFPDPLQNKSDNMQGSETYGKIFKQSDNPLFRSGLLFAGANNAWQGKPVAGIEDGILTAYEVSNMYLPNTRLVVLSACETALGDIHGSEGVYGLQRAFKMAGVQNLVMSLWKVPDAETAEFMQLFYKNMFDKQSISDAFYNAQTTMKNKYRNDPYKWAAWVLVR